LLLQDTKLQSAILRQNWQVVFFHRSFKWIIK